MNIKKTFNSIDNKHQIDITIICEIAWFNIIKLDFESFKTFLILLKDVMIYIKDNKCEYIKQYINKNDVEYFKKSSKVELDNDIYSITTKIDNFLDEIINVFDIKKV